MKCSQGRGVEEGLQQRNGNNLDCKDTRTPKSTMVTSLVLISGVKEATGTLVDAGEGV